MKQLRIKVTGKVQGVSFRASAKEQADKLGLSGFVRNEPNGVVYIEAEGPQEKLDEFLSWCKSGPEAARVESTETELNEPQGHSGFEIY